MHIWFLCTYRIAIPSIRSIAGVLQAPCCRTAALPWRSRVAPGPGPKAPLPAACLQSPAPARSCLATDSKLCAGFQNQERNVSIRAVLKSGQLVLIAAHPASVETVVSFPPLQCQAFLALSPRVKQRCSPAAWRTPSSCNWNCKGIAQPKAGWLRHACRFKSW